MSLDFASDKPVTIEQLIEAGKRCGIDISEIPNEKDSYLMSWDVDDFENYATNVITNPDTQNSFRDCFESEDGRFIMRRQFWLADDGIFSYAVYGLSGRCSDDLGIAHRLMEEVGIELICLDALYDEIYQEHIKGGGELTADGLLEKYGDQREDMNQAEIMWLMDLEYYGNNEPDEDGLWIRPMRLITTEGFNFNVPQEEMEEDEVGLSVKNEQREASNG